jgi:hypothetical protein
VGRRLANHSRSIRYAARAPRIKAKAAIGPVTITETRAGDPSQKFATNAVDATRLATTDVSTASGNDPTGERPRCRLTVVPSRMNPTPQLTPNKAAGAMSPRPL